MLRMCQCRQVLKPMAFKKVNYRWHWLSYCRLAPREFNSYGSRRGNDAVMARGTFANIRLVNKLIGKAAPKTIHVPSGDTVRWSVVLIMILWSVFHFGGFQVHSLLHGAYGYFLLNQQFRKDGSTLNGLVRFDRKSSVILPDFRTLLFGQVQNASPFLLYSSLNCFLLLFWSHLLIVFCRWMCLMHLSVIFKRDANLLSWPARIMGRDHHVTGRLKDLGCRYVALRSTSYSIKGNDNITILNRFLSVTAFIFFQVFSFQICNLVFWENNNNNMTLFNEGNIIYWLPSSLHYGPP